MKSVMLSIQPKWCELIASGKKTIEVRKAVPSIPVPFKCYIYQTKKKWIYKLLEKLGLHKGKVIGEFVCDSIEQIVPDYNPKLGKFFYGYVADLSPTCLSEEELHKYAGIEPLYFWHISDLKIYDKPKELSGFKTIKIIRGYHKKNETKTNGINIERLMHSGRVQVKYLDRPPQSWFYVED